MRTDQYGQMILSESDLIDLYLCDSTALVSKCLVDTKITFDPELELTTFPLLIQYSASCVTLDEFDAAQQANWNMPREYYEFDIAEWVLNQCKTSAELERAAQELLLFQDRGMFILLSYMKFLVDTMRKNNIVWGVGRGSSIASFVLFLIGVHRINSLQFELPITEFIKSDSTDNK